MHTKKEVTVVLMFLIKKKRILHEMFRDKKAMVQPSGEDVKKWVAEQAESQRVESEAVEVSAEAEMKKAEAERDGADAEEESAEAQKDEAAAEKEKADAEREEAEAAKEKARAELNQSENKSAPTTEGSSNEKESVEVAKAQAEATIAQAEVQKAETKLEGKRFKQDVKDKKKEDAYSKMVNEPEQKPSKLLVVLGVISILFVILVYKASGFEGVMNIIPVLLLLFGIVILVVSKGQNMTGAIMLLALEGFLLYKSGGALSFSAIMPIVLLIVCIIVNTKTKNNPNTLATIAVMVMLAIALFMLATDTLPYVMASVQSRGGIQQVIKDTSTETATATTTGLGGFWEDIISSYDNQLAIVKGEKIAGNVDQSVKETVGLFIEPIKSVKQIREDELYKDRKYIEGFTALISGFDPKTPIEATVICSINNQSSISTSKSEFNMYPGIKQEMDKSRLSGTAFFDTVTCRPVFPDCGKHQLTLTAQADNLRTDAHMDNWVIDKEMLDDSLLEYAKSGNSLLSKQDFNTAIKSTFPTVGDHRSVSDKGSIKVIMATLDSPLIGLNDDTHMTLRVGIENALDGWIVGVNSLVVTIPEFLTVLDSKGGYDYCLGWEVQGNQLSLSQERINGINFTRLEKDEQKLFSCSLVLAKDVYEVIEPTPATFLAQVDYNYVVQEKFDIDIRDKDGKSCKPGQKGLVV